MERTSSRLSDNDVEEIFTKIFGDDKWLL
jgi:hypothetical protein